jgi:hypothetical protein
MLMRGDVKRDESLFWYHTVDSKVPRIRLTNQTQYHAWTLRPLLVVRTAHSPP